MTNARGVRRSSAILASLMAVLLLSGCGSIFGKAKGPPLPGKRISVLQDETSLHADATASAVISIPPPRANADWPEPTGNTTANMQNLAGGDFATLAWHANVGDGVHESRPVIPLPIVAEGHVYTMDTEHVVSAFDLATGREIWQRDLADDEEDDDVIPGGIAYDSGLIFVTTGFGKIFALAGSNGKDVWQKRVLVPVHRPPTVLAGRVFIVTLDNTLRALNSADGADVWTPYQAITENAALVNGAGPTSDGDIVVAPFSSGEVAALTIENGRVLWTDTLGSTRRTDELASLAHIHGAPIIDQGRVFAISYAGEFAAIDLRTGHRLWDRAIGSQLTPWIAGNQLFLITNEQEIVCVSANDGSILWVRRLPQFENKKKSEDPIFWVGPVMANGRLIIASSTGRLEFLSPLDGSTQETRQLPEGVTRTPIVANGSLIILDKDANLSVYR